MSYTRRIGHDVREPKFDPNRNERLFRIALALQIVCVLLAGAMAILPWVLE